MSHEIFDLVNRACDLLLIYGRDKNGFFQQQIGIGKSAAPTTANAILALYESAKLDSDQLKDFLEELLDLQDRQKFLFCKNEGLSTWATSKALITILSITPEKLKEERIHKAVEALLNTQNLEDGGWGYSKGYISRPYYSYFAIEALSSAYSIGVPEKTERKIESSMRRTADYLKKTMILKGVWGKDKSSDVPCALGTLTALGTLKEIEVSLAERFIDEEMLDNGIQIVDELSRFDEWKKYAIIESGVPFSIQPSIPGKVPIILKVFGRTKFAFSLIRWLLKNYKQYNNAVGWCPLGCKDENPYVWTTALGIRSLLHYVKETRVRPQAHRLEEKDVIPFWKQEAKELGLALVNNAKFLVFVLLSNVFILSTQLLVIINFKLVEIVSSYPYFFVPLIIQVTSAFLSIQLYISGDISIREAAKKVYKVFKMIKDIF